MMRLIKKTIKFFLFKVKNKGKKVSFPFSSDVGISSVFEGGNVIGLKSSFTGRLGYGSYIGSNSSLTGKIGRFCSISDNVHVVSGRHPTKNFISTHPAFFSPQCQAGFSYSEEQHFEEFRNAEGDYNVVIGNDVWIGFGAIILEGITIGDGAVIAAGAVVIKDVAPYTIVGGVPAKKIGQRFDDEQINKLLSFAWWDRPIDWIKENAKYFRSEKEFFSKMREME